MMQVQAVDFGVSASLLNGGNRLFCRLDGLTPAIREQQRINTLKGLGLLETETVPVFEEAAQTAARFIEVPICILGTMVHDRLWLKSAVGLSHLGLMNQLASSRQIPRLDAFCTYVIDSQQPLVINDTLSEAIFARSFLAQHYGIRAYLGTPLMTADGQCIGTLAVMDLVPRQFTIRDVEFLTLTARWCLREFERNHLLTVQSSDNSEWLVLPSAKSESQPHADNHTENDTQSQSSFSNSIASIKLKLLQQLTQELRTPLTAVIGMSSVLRGEVFGALTKKQKEYLEIIHTSGQHINSLVEEILKLGVNGESASQLQLSPLNIEMLCQQALNCLADVAKQKRQTLRLSVEPGKRIWLLDKEKVRQALYYLVISVLESSEAGGEIRIHVSRRSKTLNIAVWVSHPWLGDGLPQVALYHALAANPVTVQDNTSSLAHDSLDPRSGQRILTTSSLESILDSETIPKSPDSNPQELLGLLLGCYLAESHGGSIIVQGAPESGYRYILTLPKIATDISCPIN